MNTQKTKRRASGKTDIQRRTDPEIERQKRLYIAQLAAQQQWLASQKAVYQQQTVERARQEKSKGSWWSWF